MTSRPADESPLKCNLFAATSLDGIVGRMSHPDHGIDARSYPGGGLGLPPK